MSHPKFIVRIFQKLGYVPDRITRHLHCAWCGEQFDWEGFTKDDHPKFCSNGHKKNAQEARKKRREVAKMPPKNSKKRPPAPIIDLSQVGKCPNPYKITFRTREEAETVIQKVDPSMHVYKCECGGLHIGHRKRSKR